MDEMLEERQLLEENIARVKAGEDDAYTHLVRRYFGMVYAVAYARVREREAAEEIAQETFLRGYFSMRSLRDPRVFPTWLVSIARNLASDWLVTGQRRSRMLAMIPFDDIGREIPDESAPSPRDLRQSVEERHLIRDAVMQLPPDLREVVMLHYQEGMSKSDIARLNNVNPSTVGRQLDKALGLLRVSLDDTLRETMRPLGPRPAAADKACLAIAVLATLPAAARAGIEAAAAHGAPLAPTASSISAGGPGFSATAAGLAAKAARLLISPSGVLCVAVVIAGASVGNHAYRSSSRAAAAREREPARATRVATGSADSTTRAARPAARHTAPAARNHASSVRVITFDNLAGPTRPGGAPSPPPGAGPDSTSSGLARGLARKGDNASTQGERMRSHRARIDSIVRAHRAGRQAMEAVRMGVSAHVSTKRPETTATAPMTSESRPQPGWDRKHPDRRDKWSTGPVAGPPPGKRDGERPSPSIDPLPQADPAYARIYEALNIAPDDIERICEIDVLMNELVQESGYRRAANSPEFRKLHAERNRLLGENNVRRLTRGTPHRGPLFPACNPLDFDTDLAPAFFAAGLSPNAVAQLRDINQQLIDLQTEQDEVVADWKLRDLFFRQEELVPAQQGEAAVRNLKERGLIPSDLPELRTGCPPPPPRRTEPRDAATTR